jgi:hypothetical protein
LIVLADCVVSLAHHARVFGAFGRGLLAHSSGGGVGGGAALKGKQWLPACIDPDVQHTTKNEPQNKHKHADFLFAIARFQSPNIAATEPFALN